MFGPLMNEVIDEWFQRLNAPLNRLPIEERAEIHSEVRQHLDALAAANEELGSSPEEAWRLALAQFGDPSLIGRRLVREWRRSRQWVSMDMLLLLSGMAAQAAALLGIFAVDFLCKTSERTTLLSLLGMPLLAGMVMGRTCPWKALPGALYGALVWPILPAVAAFPLFSADPPACVFSQMAFLLAWWLGLTGTGAYIASVPRRGWYRPSRSDFNPGLPRKQPKLSP